MPIQPINHKLHGLDHLRAFAITIVFLYHYGIFAHPAWIETINSFGWTGVDLFFVLSGFLIASQLLAEEDISLRNFYIKRVFRIFPAYFLVVALYFCFPALRERSTPAPLWKFLTFTQNIGLDLKQNGAFSHAWSLCIEEQFYLLLPLLMILLPKKVGAWLIGILFVAGFGIRLFCWYHFVAPATTDSWVVWYKWIYYPTFCRLDGLLVGVTLAAIQRHTVKYRIHLLIIGGVLITGAYILCQDEDLFNQSIFGFPLIAIAYGCIVAGAAGAMVKKNLVTGSLAALSYAVYLSHKIVIHVTQDLLGQWVAPNGTWMFLICVITCLAAAWLLRYLVEKPFLRWRNSLIGQRIDK
jgi:peptidoglycan/LPS O-acetylase OafA/YrhL